MLQTSLLGSEYWVPGASLVGLDEVTPAGSRQCHCKEGMQPLEERREQKYAGGGGKTTDYYNGSCNQLQFSDAQCNQRSMTYSSFPK